MLTPDTVLQDRYLIVSHVGKGGMGTVYRATDKRLRNTVALKEMAFSNDPVLRKAFEREASLLAELRHPALPKVIDHFDEAGGQFLVMEFIPGEDLAEMLAGRGAPFPIEEVLTWGDQLLDALDYLHCQEIPIIHRDIKPQNLKLTSRGQIILLDFGLAKGSLSQMTRVTTSGSIVGYTPAYAPPEQLQGTGTDPRSDLFAFAATIYHLMTGTPPADALGRALAVMGGQVDPLRPANAINGQVPVSVVNILQQALSLNRDGRPSTAGDMRRALKGEGHFFNARAEDYKAAQVATTIAAPRKEEAQTAQQVPPTPPQQPVTVPEHPPVSTLNSYAVSPSHEKGTGSRPGIIKMAIIGAMIGAVIGGITGPILLFTIYSNLSSNHLGEFVLGYGIYGVLIGAIGLPILSRLIKYVWS